MKTNKNARKNNKVQKLEKETAVKVTALAIIPKPMILLLTAKRTHNCRSGGANHAQDTACNGNG